MRPPIKALMGRRSLRELVRDKWDRIVGCRECGLRGTHKFGCSCWDRIERAGHRVVPWVVAACAIAVFLVLAFEPDCEPVRSARDCAQPASLMKGAK
jgi:hypothetical protein